jgi:hypothetical protein
MNTGCTGGGPLDAPRNSLDNVRTWPERHLHLLEYPSCEAHTVKYHSLIWSHLYLNHRTVIVTQHGMRLYRCHSTLNETRERKANTCTLRHGRWMQYLGTWRACAHDPNLRQCLGREEMCNLFVSHVQDMTGPSWCRGMSRQRFASFRLGTSCRGDRDEPTFLISVCQPARSALVAICFVRIFLSSSASRVRQNLLVPRSWTGSEMCRSRNRRDQLCFGGGAPHIPGKPTESPARALPSRPAWTTMQHRHERWHPIAPSPPDCTRSCISATGFSELPVSYLS